MAKIHVPLFDSVKILPKANTTVEKMNAIGLILAENSSTEREELTQGVIIAIGSQVKQVNVGDEVSFGMHAGYQQRELNGEIISLSRKKEGIVYLYTKEKYLLTKTEEEK